MTTQVVILAAGMGSRFGGDKQLAVLGSTGRTLLHFSVQDAYAAGVRTLVLVVRQNIVAALEQQHLGQLGVGDRGQRQWRLLDQAGQRGEPADQLPGLGHYPGQGQRDRQGRQRWLSG